MGRQHPAGLTRSALSCNGLSLAFGLRNNSQQLKLFQDNSWHVHTTTVTSMDAPGPFRATLSDRLSPAHTCLLEKNHLD